MKFAKKIVIGILCCFFLDPISFLKAASLPLAQASSKKLVYQEDFSSPQSYWVEGWGIVHVKEHRLYQEADSNDPKKPVFSTVWLRKPLPENFEIHIRACVVASGIDANNINFFFCYKDPSGKNLEESRTTRTSGKYDLYHQLEGYIFTFICETSDKAPAMNGDARFRLRRCPGFRLIGESREGNSVREQIHNLVIQKNGGRIQAWIDGTKRVEAIDSQPLSGGLLGLRTYCTTLWWSDLKVYELDSTNSR